MLINKWDVITLFEFALFIWQQIVKFYTYRPSVCSPPNLGENLTFSWGSDPLIQNYHLQPNLTSPHTPHSLCLALPFTLPQQLPPSVHFEIYPLIVFILHFPCVCLLLLLCNLLKNKACCMFCSLIHPGFQKRTWPTVGS